MPAVTIFGNPKKRRRKKGEPDVIGVVSTNVLEIRYIHAQDHEPYKHVFGKGVCCEFRADGTALLYQKDGKPVWGEF
jgi:hypothetical protein